MTTMMLELEPMLLERPEPIDVPADCARLLELADEAAKLGAVVKLPREARSIKSRRQGDQLAESLREIGVPSVYTSPSLGQYKEAEVKRLKRKYKGYWVSGIGGFLLLGVMAWAIFLGPPPDSHATPGNGVMTIVATVFFAGAILAMGGVILSNIGWRSYQLWEYNKRSVPLEAHELIVKIKQALPDAELYIIGLERSDNAFLVVSHGDREYYVYHWT